MPRAASLPLTAIFRCLLIVGLGLLPRGVAAQDVDLQDRPIAEIRLEGLQRVSEQTVRNQIRAAVGDPYDATVIRDDIRRINRLGEFRSVEASAVQRDDGTLTLVYRLEEQAIINEVQVVGNKLISDQDLRGVVRQFPGLARDDYLIENAKQAMIELYRQRGHYLATVSVNQLQLEQNGVLLFEVLEGPRVRIRAVEFEGNGSFPDDRLMSEIKTRPAISFIRKGVLDEDVLVADLGALDRFYKSRGYLDVRVDRRIELSPDSREAKVTFLLDEGRQFTLRSVTVEPLFGDEPLQVFAPEQITALLEIRPGDIFRQDLVDRSVRSVREAYERLGYISDGSRPVRAEALRTADGSQVDLLLQIDEGNRYRVGVVNISGNFLTRDKVIRRQVRLRPGRIFDGAELEEARARLARTRLFNDVRITLQPPDPAEPEFRDVLVEIKERNTGSVNFGVALGSDAGVFGELSVSQSNFDITDLPASMSELVRGAAFRGGGQRFNMTLRPGNELFQYSASIVEPHIFESDYSLGVSGGWFSRSFSDYDEERLRGTLTVGRALGDVWSFSTRLRWERVELSDIDPDAPTEVYRDSGPDTLSGIELALTRTTLEPLTRPASGGRLEFSYEYVGAFGGDFDFSKVSAEYTTFFTLKEDFLGRRTTLRLNTRASYIVGGRAPTYERYYLGGSSFRGFDFRTVSPKGVTRNGQPADEIGGDWLFFAGAQYEFPLFQNALSGVFFVDSGTVLEDIGFDEYRVSAGAGIRISIPALGPVPIAIDFGFPIQKQPEDDNRTLTFSAELPF
ncbi:MAG: outer membrane protein assembly factor BamA [Planctomycetota bacterium]|jgi:outer membrane protein insertion porin family